MNNVKVQCPICLAYVDPEEMSNIDDMCDECYEEEQEAQDLLDDHIHEEEQ